MPAVVLRDTLCPMPCHIRDAVEDRFLACYSPIQFVCLSFRALRGLGVLVSSILVAVWHCAVLETSCGCDLQQVFQVSSPAICDSGLSGQFRADLGWSFPVGSRHDFTPASKEHSILSLRSVSLVLPCPFAWCVWACSLTSPLVPLIKLRLRPSISDKCQQPFASYNVNFAASGPPGLHTTTRELQTRTFERPGASNTTKIPRKRPKEREKE